MIDTVMSICCRNVKAMTIFTHICLHGFGRGNHKILIYPKEKKKLKSGTVEFMNESALAAKRSHYSPQPPQNCCVIGRELFPMQRSSLAAPTHQRWHVGMKGCTPAASLSSSWGLDLTSTLCSQRDLDLRSTQVTEAQTEGLLSFRGHFIHLI